MSLRACAPVAWVGTGAWKATSGATNSSVIFAMTSASPLLRPSWKRRYVSLRFVACAGFRKWQELGRFVRKGEKGIAIFAPCKYLTKVETDDDEEQTVSQVRGRCRG